MNVLKCLNCYECFKTLAGTYNPFCGDTYNSCLKVETGAHKFYKILEATSKF
jgi:hypothetical protein